MTCAQERETIINWNDAGELVSIYTASQPVAKRCTRQGFKLEKVDTVKEKPCSWWFSCPKNCISFRRQSTKKPMSEARKAQLASHMTRARQAQLSIRKISLETQATANQEVCIKQKEAI
jgi:hypothetical protein